MSQYAAPLRDMQFVLHELLEIEREFDQLPAHADLDGATVDQILDQGRKFAAQVLFPPKRVGDREECLFEAKIGNASTHGGFVQAYQQFVDADWPALSCHPDYDGRGLPVVVYKCVSKMMNAANQARFMYPGLSHGAHTCLHANGTAEQKNNHLPNLVK